jgi:hypothetical protein
MKIGRVLPNRPFKQGDLAKTSVPDSDVSTEPIFTKLGQTASFDQGLLFVPNS